MEERAADVHVLSLLSSSSAGFDPLSDIIRGPPSLSMNVPGIMRHKGKIWWRNDLNLLYNKSVRHTSLLERPSVTLMTTFNQADWSQTDFSPVVFLMQLCAKNKLSHKTSFIGVLKRKGRFPPHKGCRDPVQKNLSVPSHLFLSVCRWGGAAG